MASETMTSQERVQAAIRLEKPDRVPIAILATAAPFARISGMTAAEFYSNEEKALDAIYKVFDDVGGWDLDLGSLTGKSIMMMKTVMTLALGLRLAYPAWTCPMTTLTRHVRRRC